MGNNQGLLFSLQKLCFCKTLHGFPLGNNQGLRPCMGQSSTKNNIFVQYFCLGFVTVMLKLVILMGLLFCLITKQKKVLKLKKFFNVIKSIFNLKNQ